MQQNPLDLSCTDDQKDTPVECRGYIINLRLKTKTALTGR